MSTVPPLSVDQAVAVYRTAYPACLVCSQCAVLLATMQKSYAKSNLTEAQRVAYVCAECRLEIKEAERVRASKLANLEKAHAARRDDEVRRAGIRRRVKRHRARKALEGVTSRSAGERASSRVGVTSAPADHREINHIRDGSKGVSSTSGPEMRAPGRPRKHASARDRKKSWARAYRLRRKEAHRAA